MTKVLAFIAFCLCYITATGELSPILWYDAPASQWEEALPLGNGKIGAMIYGNPQTEEIQISEETVWGGSPYNNCNPKAKEALDEIRQLIFDGKNQEAQQLCGPAICSPNGANGMPFQTVGSLKLNFQTKDDICNYKRTLDLSQAIATVSYKAGDVSFNREIFTSLTDSMLVIKLKASEPGQITFSATYSSPYDDAIVSISPDNLLQLNGKGSDHEGIEGKIRFTALTKICHKGGTLETIGDSTLSVSGADEATIHLTVGTNFTDYKTLSGNSEMRARQQLNKSSIDYGDLKDCHIAAYRHYYDRVGIDLGKDSQANLSTDIRLKQFTPESDPALIALYFQFGRYLLISSSQPGGQAANLQGIWNDKLHAPWDGKYTTDINVEMNYWPAEVTNLAELHQPFIQLIKNCSVSGREAAEMYGCRGWTLHHNTDIWCATGAVDGPKYGIWPTANAWFCQHLYDRYLFSQDRRYLDNVYPIMKEACRFYFDFLVKEPKNGYLVVAPSYSPENAPMVNGLRNFVIVAGATMDNQMVGDLFRNTIEAATILNEDKAFIDSLRAVSRQLPPMKVGRWGQLQEWLEDWDNPNDRHRHSSNLWGLYPGRQITADDKPFFDAARVSLEGRGDKSTGWSMGWKVCLWARLLDGDHALKLIADQLRPVTETKGQNGGTYPNLFDAHPPFQIDGNFGCTAGIAEMLIQSHASYIQLLPALPSSWSEGEVCGLRARGGFVAEKIVWTDNMLNNAVIRSTAGGTLRLKSPVKLYFNNTDVTESLVGDSYIYELNTQPNDIIDIKNEP